MKAEALDPSGRSTADGVSEGRPEQCQAQLHRLLQSSSFRDTPSSRRLLEYIATRSLEGNQEHLKEFTIGVEVLGRRMDFDPKTDTIVRVQMRRLRQKISHYYETEGVDDPVTITIPKGSYAAEFSLRETHTPEPEMPQASLHSDDPAAPVDEPRLSPLDRSTGHMQHGKRHGLRFPLVLMLVLAAVMGGAATGYWLAQLEAKLQPTSIDQLWTAMLKGDDSPIIGYPDAVFILDGSSDMFQFTEGPVGIRGELVDPNVARKFALNPTLIAGAGPLYYETGGYTGTGEIESVAALSTLLSRLGFHPRVVRSHEITASDLRNHNVVLLGGASQNKAVRDFLMPGDFEYNYTPKAWGGKIVNLHPAKGEAAALYQVERNPVTHAVNGDYALISCLPSIGSTHRIITIGGLDTTGTLGGTLYATSTEGAEKLSTSFGQKYQTPYFQAVVHVLLTHGNQVLNVQPATIHAGPVDQTMHAAQ